MISRKLHFILAFSFGLLMAVGMLTTMGKLGDMVKAEQAETANVLTVCGAGPPDCDYAIIQDAVDAATDGALIKLAAGVYSDINCNPYSSQVVYLDKSIAIRGGYETPGFTDPPDPKLNPTTLDAQGQARVIRIVPAEERIDVVIEGLRITGGWTSDQGGGLSMIDANVTLRGNTIISNSAESWGGGLEAQLSTLTFDSNTIISNSAVRDGGGAWLLSSDAVLMGNNVSFNTTEGDGGGLYIESCDASIIGNSIAFNTGGGIDLSYCHNAWIENNTFTSNSGAMDGGGLHMFNCDNTTIARNTFTSNRASYGGAVHIESINVRLRENMILSNTAYLGGGLLLRSPDALVNGNTFLYNTATGHSGVGGGILISRSDNARFDRNTIISNTAETGGGLHFASTENVAFSNTVIADNHASMGGSGLYVIESSANLNHTTFARNTGGDGSALRLGYEFMGPFSTVTLTNTILVSHVVGVNVPGGTVRMDATLWGTDTWANDADWNGNGTIITGTVNIWDNPAFVDPHAGDYHIGPGSAAIDSGINIGVQDDIDDQVRPHYDGFDLGADEWWPLVPIKTADPDTAKLEETITYSLMLENANDVAMTVWITDALPDQVSYLGPLVYDHGDGGYSSDVITWMGTVYTATPTYITWPVKIASDAPISMTIENAALISDTYGRYSTKPAFVLVLPHHVYLPVVLSNW